MSGRSASFAEVAAVLREYGADLLAEPVPVADSVINANYRAETQRGALFVKRHHQKRTRERLELEQAAIAWAHAAGVPVALTLRAQDGRTLVESGGATWSVYPWVEGTTLRRGSITGEGAAFLGRTHGMLQRALAEHPVQGLPHNSELTWDTRVSLEALATVAPEVGSRGTEQERRWLNQQRTLLESGAGIPCEDFAHLPMQATHGDFHERNVLTDDSGTALAIVDWERFCVQPAAFELLRAVSFMLLLDGAPLRTYLEGFRREYRLDETTVRPAVEAFWQSALHNTWAFRDAFLAGNEAPRQFLPEEESRSARFNDPAFREWLSETIIRAAC